MFSKTTGISISRDLYFTNSRTGSKKKWRTGKNIEPIESRDVGNIIKVHTESADVYHFQYVTQLRRGLAQINCTYMAAKLLAVVPLTD